MQNESSRIRQLTAQPDILYFAAEYPISVHDVVSELTDYEFLIALVAISSRKYKKLFTSEQHAGKYRIVDSGVFEDPNNPPVPEKLVEVALELNADEVVATDYIGEKQQTIDSVNAFLEVDSKFPFKVMAVPQGKDFVEWLECYHEFVHNPRIDVIGATYHKHPAGLEEVGIASFGIPNQQEAARLAMLHLLAGGLGLHVAEHSTSGGVTKPIHILGCGDCRAIPYYRRWPFVRSIDTSFPVQLAIEGRALKMSSLKAQSKVDFGTTLARGQQALIASNTLRFANLCHGIADYQMWDVEDRLGRIWSQ